MKARSGAARQTARSTPVWAAIIETSVELRSCQSMSRSNSEAQFDDGLQEPAGNSPSTQHRNPSILRTRALDEAFSFIVRSTFAAGRRHPADLAGALLWQTAWAGCAGRP